MKDKEDSIEHKLLKEMINYAEKHDVREVKILDKQYENIIVRSYHNPLTPIELEMENCRQSCVMSVTTFKIQHDELIRDAKHRYKKILNKKWKR